jgi:hypothetical protein
MQTNNDNNNVNNNTNTDADADNNANDNADDNANVNANPVIIFIKEAYTETRYSYVVYTDWTIRLMMNALAPQLARDFNLEREPPHLFPMANLIPFGFPDGEEGSNCSSIQDLQLKQLWVSELAMGFYLKRIEVIDLTNED